MKYRKFGNLDWEVSVLGFGAMRCPFLEKDTANVDEPKAIEIIRHAIEHGVNYLDTVNTYHEKHGEIFECEEKCPQGFPISKDLKKAHALLDKKE